MEKRRDLRQAGFDALRPMVRLLRASGLTAREIEKLIVEALRASRHEPVRGVTVDPHLFEFIANVPARWSQDALFVDDSGVPRLLPRTLGSKSFAALCRRVHRQLDPALALSVLSDFGSVRLTDDDQVMLVSRITLQTHRGRFLSYPLLTDVQHFVETVEHNACDRGDARGLLQARASHGNDFAPGTFDQVHEFIRRHGMNFLEDAEEKMADHALPTTHRGEHYGVGVYVYRTRSVRSKKSARPSKTIVRRKQKRT